MITVCFVRTAHDSPGGLRGCSTGSLTVCAEAELEPRTIRRTEMALPLHVSKWVDFSSRYGLGYQLGDGTSGVLLNDCTKVTYHATSSYVGPRRLRVALLTARAASSSTGSRCRLADSACIHTAQSREDCHQALVTSRAGLGR